MLQTGLLVFNFISNFRFDITNHDLQLILFHLVHYFLIHTRVILYKPLINIQIIYCCISDFNTVKSVINTHYVFTKLLIFSDRVTLTADIILLKLILRLQKLSDARFIM